MRDLVSERIELGLPPSFPPAKLKEKSKKSIIAYLDDISDPDRMADLVSCFLLPAAVQRQTILETVEVESRLKHLIHFLMAEITLRRRKRKTASDAAPSSGEDALRASAMFATLVKVAGQRWP